MGIGGACRKRSGVRGSLRSFRKLPPQAGPYVVAIHASGQVRGGTPVAGHETATQSRSRVVSLVDLLKRHTFIGWFYLIDALPIDTSVNEIVHEPRLADQTKNDARSRISPTVKTSTQMTEAIHRSTFGR